MSEEQLKDLLAMLKEDPGLREKLQGAGDLDTAVALAKEAGFAVSKADWLKYQAKQTLELSDKELEAVAGSKNQTEICATGDDFRSACCSVVILPSAGCV
jgi:predicted ribosomally synthesized peptide with nif11-like leader